MVTCVFSNRSIKRQLDRLEGTISVQCQAICSHAFRQPSTPARAVWVGTKWRRICALSDRQAGEIGFRSGGKALGVPIGANVRSYMPIRLAGAYQSPPASRDSLRADLDGTVLRTIAQIVERCALHGFRRRCRSVQPPESYVPTCLARLSQ